MKTIRFYFDPISPFAYLAFEHLPQVLAGRSYAVEYRPILFAGLLKHWGQKGPAEIEPKRAWTFRHLAWWAQRAGIRLDAPAQHPFNPLPLLRLALACEEVPAGGQLAAEAHGFGPNRRVVEALFSHVWHGGQDATDPHRLVALEAKMAPMQDPNSDSVKLALRQRTEAAVALGVFGIPSFELDDRLFWGLDALEMLRDAVDGTAWFESPNWANAGATRPGLKRRW